MDVGGGEVPAESVSSEVTSSTTQRPSTDGTPREEPREGTWVLTRSEEALIEVAAAGVPCDLSDTSDRLIRAPVLVALLTGEGPVDSAGRACWSAHRRGLELVGVTIEGDVDLRHAQIAAPLTFTRCQFTGRFLLDEATTNSLHFVDTELQRGFEADALSVNGSLYFDDGFRSPTHQVRLMYASIARNLYCVGATFGGRTDRDGKSSDYVFRADGTTVKGAIQWRRHPEGDRTPTTAAGTVRLVGVTAGYLADELDQWPERVQLWGFVYGQLLSDPANRTVEGRIRWVRRSNEPPLPRRRDRLERWWKRFRGTTDHSPMSTQPYQQLAKIYRELGRDADARTVLRARWYDELKEGPSQIGKIPVWMWRWLLQATVGNGYQPARILLWLAALFAVGLVIVDEARDSGVLVPMAAPAAGSPTPTAGSCTSDFDCLDPVPYVLDILTPFDLGEQGDWRVDDTAGIRWRLAFWTGIVLGWALSAIFLASFTSVIRRE